MQGGVSFFSDLEALGLGLEPQRLPFGGDQSFDDACLTLVRGAPNSQEIAAPPVLVEPPPRRWGKSARGQTT
jgi:hypothetical protein